MLNGRRRPGPGEVKPCAHQGRSPGKPFRLLFPTTGSPTQKSGFALPPSLCQQPSLVMAAGSVCDGCSRPKRRKKKKNAGGDRPAAVLACPLGIRRGVHGFPRAQGREKSRTVGPVAGRCAVTAGGGTWQRGRSPSSVGPLPVPKFEKIVRNPIRVACKGLPRPADIPSVRTGNVRPTQAGRPEESAGASESHASRRRCHGGNHEGRSDASVTTFETPGRPPGKAHGESALLIAPGPSRPSEPGRRSAGTQPPTEPGMPPSNTTSLCATKREAAFARVGARRSGGC